MLSVRNPVLEILKYRCIAPSHGTSVQKFRNLEIQVSSFSVSIILCYLNLAE